MRDRKSLLNLVEKAGKKAATNGLSLQHIKTGLADLLRLIKAWAKGHYREVPWSTVAKAVAAVVYFLNPLDAIPDMIIGAGLLDDVTVIAYVVRSLATDLEKFRAWEARQPVEVSAIEPR